MDDCHIKFDFLGKDSIRYENEVQVHPRVYDLVKEFCRKDQKGNRELSHLSPMLPDSSLLCFSCLYAPAPDQGSMKQG